MRNEVGMSQRIPIPAPHLLKCGMRAEVGMGLGTRLRKHSLSPPHSIVIAAIRKSTEYDVFWIGLGHF